MTMIEKVKAAMLATETDVTMWDDEPLTELAHAAIEAVFAGSVFVEFDGKVVVTNMDFPACYWDGKRIVEILPMGRKTPVDLGSEPGSALPK